MRDTFRIAALRHLFSLCRILFPLTVFRRPTRCTLQIIIRDPNASRPRAAQCNRLMGILRRNRTTEFGKEHRFGAIRGIDDFRHAVPVRGYEEFEFPVSRMIDGEPGVLTNEPVEYFATTSGSSGRQKFVPVTRAYRAEYSSCLRLWKRHFVLAFPEVTRAFPLFLLAGKSDGATRTGIPCGPISRLLGGEGFFAAKRFSPVPDFLQEIEDYDARHYLILLFAGRQRISAIAALNPGTILLLSDLLAASAPRLIRDLSRGGIGPEILLSKAHRTLAEEMLPPAPRVSDRLRRLIDRKPAMLLRDLWPDLAGAACWKTGSSSFYHDALSRALGDIPTLDFGLLATEGAFSYPHDPRRPGCMFAAGAHFCEFVPSETRAATPGDPFPATLLCDELEQGSRYRVIVTASHGLYRYDLGDVVEVTGHRGFLPEIAFVERAGVLSLAGEKVGESHVTHATRSAAADLSLALAGFSVTARPGNPPHYILAVEPERPTSGERLGEMLDRWDKHMREVNSEYREKRLSGRLGPPALRTVPSGGYQALRKKRIEAGSPEAQVKPPVLFFNPDEMDRLLVDET